jgi:hypothetical protein
MSSPLRPENAIGNKKAVTKNIGVAARTKVLVFLKNELETSTSSSTR